MTRRAKVPEGRIIFSVDESRSAGSGEGKDLFFTGVAPETSEARIAEVPPAHKGSNGAPSRAVRSSGRRPVAAIDRRSATPKVGGKLGDYNLLAELGRSPSGVLYRARRADADQDLVLKVIHPWLTALPAFVDGMVAALRSAAALRHLNIVPIHEVGEADSYYYVAYEFVNGRSASRLLRDDGPPDPQRAVRIAIQVAVALDYAHAKGVIHGALKANNVLVDWDDRAFVADFSLTSTADEAARAASGATVLGAVEYLSPELLSGQAASKHSDRYAFAVILFELLTGAPPFRSGGPAGVIAGHLGKKPPSVVSVRPSLPPALDPVFARALSKNPEQRYPGCTALVHAVADALRGEVAVAAPVKQVPAEPRPAPKRGEAGKAVGIVLLALFVMLALASLLSRVDFAAISEGFVSALSPTILGVSPTAGPTVGQTTVTMPTAPPIVVVSPAPATPTPPPPTATAELPPTPASTPVPVAAPAEPTGTLVVVRPAAGGANSLYTVSLDGKSLAPIAGLPVGWNWAPSVSPGGEWVAFATGSPSKSDIAIISQNGTDFRRIVSAGEYSLTSPWWVPNGQIAFTGSVAQRSEIYWASLDGGQATQITGGPGALPETRIATWPREGGDMAFSAKLGAFFRVFLQGASGQPRPISPDKVNAYTPAWSPDGKQVAFSATLADGRSGIFAVAPDGSGLVQKAKSVGGTYTCCPVWSPDGNWLAYMAEVGAAGQTNLGNVYIVANGGGEPRRVLGDGKTYYWRPAWLP